jgi:pimeloyl-ACP methyl ester carboxylesterase
LDGEDLFMEDITISLPSHFTTKFSHHETLVNEIRLHYVIGGIGKPVILLHGFTETWYTWHRIIPELAEHYTVIALDLPGLGDSGEPTEGRYDTCHLATYPYQLMQQLGYRHVSLIAHNWGSPVAYAYAAAHTSDVRHLGILDTSIPGFMPTSGAPDFWHPAFQMVPDLPEELVAGRERIYLTWFYTHLAYNPASIPSDDIDEYVRQYSKPGRMHAGFEYYRWASQDVQQNQEYAKSKLPMPVLALGGDHSWGASVLHTMQQLASNVQGGVIENCGHYIQDEQPQELTRQLLDFLKL